MLLTISTTREPATDLGYLLVKHPDRVQSFATSAGTAYVWYPEAAPERCTAALLLDVDPVRLARGRRSPADFSLGRYVNDRPYAASSLLTVAIGAVFRTAMKGAAEQEPWPLAMELPAVPCRGGAELVERLFAPLGWSVSATAVPYDPEVAEWGDAPYAKVRLTGRHRLGDALNHLYVLLPVLDDAKHYWVTTDEVDKLLRAGEGWLAGHPERELITQRYLHHQRQLTETALQRLRAADDEAVEEDTNAAPKPLVAHRRDAVLAALAESGASRVLDLGCGPGSLLLELAAQPRYAEIVGADVSSGDLRTAERRLERLPERQRQRVKLLQTALTYHDDRLTGYDAAVLMEVVEHVDETRLPALERAVFGHAAPATVIVTTPNAEYNVRYQGLAAGHLRHADHRFEWTRAQFTAWAEQVAARHGYTVEVRPVGEVDPEVGAPTQLAYFRRAV